MTELPADAVPVISVDGERLGYVYRAPGDHEHWSTVTPRGYRSPWNYTSMLAAVGALANLEGLAPDDRCVDPALTAELARLGQRFGPLGVALAAAYLSDPDVVADYLSPPGRAEGAPVPAVAVAEAVRGG